MKKCPKCETPTGRRWCKGRKLQSYCSHCGWRGKPQKPKKQKIEVSTTVWVGNFSGYHFETYDEYGHIVMSSRSHKTLKEVTNEAIKEVKSHSQIEGYGDCTAVVWPKTVKVRGVKIAMKNGKVVM